MSDLKTNGQGTLYVVATPIGNLGDITLRALEILKSVDAIAAEDTRHTSGLLSHFGISKKLIAVHEHNEQQSAEKLLAQLKNGESIAFVRLDFANHLGPLSISSKGSVLPPCGPQSRSTIARCCNTNGNAMAFFEDCFPFSSERC